MIQEAYVSFEIAKLLKEKGFQQLQDNCGYFTTEMVYSINVDKNGEHHFAHQYPAGVYNKDKYIAAPTHQMACAWLREEKNIHIDIYYLPIHRKHMWSIVETKDPKGTGSKELYEDAVEAALKYTLNNLL